MSKVDESALREELARVCASFGKSEGSRRLLSYLVESHLRGKVPRETDIALDVFNRDTRFDGSQDAVVRVAVRALRQKLDDYYHREGKQRPLRFDLPRGGYRVDVLTNDAAPLPEPAPAPASAPALQPLPAHAPAAEPTGLPPVRRSRALLTAVAAGLVLSAGLNLWLWQRDPAEAPLPVAAAPARASVLWQPLLTSRRPLTVVLGDHFLFPNPDPAPGRIQLLRDARINTDEQLRAWLGSRAETLSSEPGTQLATTLVPKGVAYGLVDVLPVVSGTGRAVEVRILDELPIDHLRTHDVLFMGPLVRIGPLAEALFGGSRYSFLYDEEPRRLRDRHSGREYSPTPGRRENATDYGLFASYRGPAGNRIMVFASVGSDLGLLPLMRRMTSREGLEELRAKLAPEAGRSPPEEFEALIEVSGYYRTDLSARLIDAHARPYRDTKPATTPAAR